VYTIYINDKPFIITDDWDHLIHDHTYQHFHSDNRLQIRKISQDLITNNKYSGAVVHAENMIKAFEGFSSDYEIVEAAGGVIENELGQILMIYRKGCWDLPKGKIEKGETEAIAAKREVMEECGLLKVEVKTKFTATYHTFFMPQKNVLKISHWYRMTSPSNDRLKPQLEEDITEIKWFTKSQIDLEKLDTYRSIQKVLDLYLN